MIGTSVTKELKSTIKIRQQLSAVIKLLVNNQFMQNILSVTINLYQTNDSFLWPVITSENVWFDDVFRGL